MKQFHVGRTIKPHESELPKNITELLHDYHYTRYFDAYERTSEKQKKVIEDRVKRKTNS